MKSKEAMLAYTRSISIGIIRWIAVGVVVLSLMFFLWNSLIFCISGFLREHNAIEVSDVNREDIEYLLSLNSDLYEDMPDIANAVKAEYLVLMHKDKVTITYDDETDFRFFIKDAYKNPLTQYIKENGYVVYFRSSEFIGDAVRMGVPLIIGTISTVFLIKSKPKSAKIRK